MADRIKKYASKLNAGKCETCGGRGYTGIEHETHSVCPDCGGIFGKWNGISDILGNSLVKETRSCETCGRNEVRMISVKSRNPDIGLDADGLRTRISAGKRILERHIGFTPGKVVLTHAEAELLGRPAVIYGMTVTIRDFINYRFPEAAEMIENAQDAENIETENET